MTHVNCFVLLELFGYAGGKGCFVRWGTAMMVRVDIENHGEAEELLNDFADRLMLSGAWTWAGGPH